MKNLVKFLTVLAMCLIINMTASAQNASTPASAVIYSALTISNTQPLNFGVIIPSAAAGNVVITPAGGYTPTNVTEHPSSTHTQAIFRVLGEPNETYDIAITNPPVTITDGTNNMSIDQISSTTAEGLNAGLLDGTGEQFINVGGRLQVGANQAAGSYTNATAITVTINYN